MLVKKSNKASVSGGGKGTRSKTAGTKKDIGAKIEELKKALDDNHKRIHELNQESDKIREEMLTLQISPFEIGGVAMCEVPSGKQRKERLCVLECIGGDLFVRPYNNDESLSGRHFMMMPIDGDYSKILKKPKK